MQRVRTESEGGKSGIEGKGGNEGKRVISRGKSSLEKERARFRGRETSGERPEALIMWGGG
jgi:hypothetical protein